MTIIGESGEVLSRIFQRDELGYYTFKNDDSDCNPDTNSSADWEDIQTVDNLIILDALYALQYIPIPDECFNRLLDAVSRQGLDNKDLEKLIRKKGYVTSSNTRELFEKIKDYYEVDDPHPDEINLFNSMEI
jgi:hypothetical protein